MFAFVDLLLCLMILINKKKKNQTQKKKKRKYQDYNSSWKKGFANCLTNCFPHGESSITVYSLKFIYYKNEVNNDFWRGTFYTTVNSLMTEVHLI